MSDSKKSTTSAGASVSDNQNALTAWPRTRGACQRLGGHGTLTITNDISIVRGEFPKWRFYVQIM